MCFKFARYGPKEEEEEKNKNKNKNKTKNKKPLTILFRPFRSPGKDSNPQPTNSNCLQRI